MTRSRFDIEYNKWLQQVNIEEEDAVWNGIQDELDFIETWDNISVRLDEIQPQKGRMDPMRYLEVLAAVAAIILIMFLPVRYFIKQTNHQAIISELSDGADKKGEKPSDEPTPFKAAKDETEVIQRKVAETLPVNNSYKKSSASFPDNRLIPVTGSKDSENTVSRNEEPDLLKIQNFPFDSDVLLASNAAIPPDFTETEFNIISESGKSSGISFRVVDVGLVYGYKNTWLLNHETRNGLKSMKLGTTLPTYHHDIGVASSFEINNRHLFGLEFLWKSEAGQDYQQYINASYVERSINLDYLKLQTFYFWKNDKLPGRAIIGGYFAKLTMAEEQQAKTRFSVDDRYRDLDYGLLAGYQLNIALHNRIIFNTGVRVSYNLVNIFEGDDITPSHFKRTNNLAASFNISLSYRF